MPVVQYTPSPSGHFAGQLGYGYRSIAEFLERAAAINAGTCSVAESAAEGVLATLDGTARVTAVLEVRPRRRTGAVSVSGEHGSGGNKKAPRTP